MLRRSFPSTACITAAGALRHLTTRDDRRVGAPPLERRPVHEGDAEQPRYATSGAGRGLRGDLNRPANTQSAPAFRPGVVNASGNQPPQQFSFDDYDARRYGSAGSGAATAAAAVHQRRLISTAQQQGGSLSGSNMSDGSMFMTPAAVAASERNRANQMNPAHMQFWMSRGFTTAEAGRRAQMAAAGTAASTGGGIPWQPQQRQQQQQWLPRSARRFGALFSGDPVANSMPIPTEIRVRNELRRQRILRRDFPEPVATGADIRPGAVVRKRAKLPKAALAPTKKKFAVKGAGVMKKAAAIEKKKKSASQLAQAAVRKPMKKLATVPGGKKQAAKAAIFTKKAQAAPRKKSMKQAAAQNLKTKTPAKHSTLSNKKRGNTVASALASVVAKRQKKLSLALPLTKATTKARVARLVQLKKEAAKARRDLKDALARSSLRARRDPAHPAYWLQQGYDLPEATEAATKYTAPGRRERAKAMMKKPSSTATKRGRAVTATRDAANDQQWLLNTIF